MSSELGYHITFSIAGINFEVGKDRRVDKSELVRLADELDRLQISYRIREGWWSRYGVSTFDGRYVEKDEIR